MQTESTITSPERQILNEISQAKGPIEDVRRAEKGKLTDTFIARLTDGRRLVIQKDRVNTSEQLVPQHKLLRVLDAFCSPVVLPIGNHGEYFIYPFVGGREFQPDNPSDFNQVALEIGTFLSFSSLYKHDQSAWERRWWRVVDYPSETEMENLVQAYGSDRLRATFTQHGSKIYTEFLEPSRLGRLRQGVIHGDFKPEHFLFNSNGKLVAVIDWGTARWDPLILDIVRPLLTLCKSLKQRERLLRKVDEHIHFTPQEYEALPYAALAVFLVELQMVIERKDRYGDSFQSKVDNKIE